MALLEEGVAQPSGAGARVEPGVDWGVVGPEGAGGERGRGAQGELQGGGQGEGQGDGQVEQEVELAPRWIREEFGVLEEVEEVEVLEKVVALEEAEAPEEVEAVEESGGLELVEAPFPLAGLPPWRRRRRPRPAGATPLKSGELPSRV